MLAKEYAVSINGITLFRDHADKRKYWYLPKEGDVHIADNGKKLSYYVYINSEMGDTDNPKFNDDINQTGGFLTLQVELGPTEAEINELKKEFKNLLPYAIRQAVTEKKANGESIDEEDFDADDIISSSDEFVLTPVIFNEGDVKLYVLGEDGAQEKPLSQVRIVGSQHPSLYGKQSAVFSVRLGGRDAEIMYNMLTCSKKNQSDDVDDSSQPQSEKYINSQISVLYDLTYKGIEPAHYVKITVDFKAIEDYWDSHFNLTGDFTYGDEDSSQEKNDKSSNTNKDGFGISIAADVDIENMYRKLIDEGSIVVQQIDFAGNNTGNPLGADDPNAIKLVKDLLSAELFTATPLPKEDFSASKEMEKLGKKIEEKKTEEKKTEEKKTEEKKTEDQQQGQQQAQQQGQQPSNSSNLSTIIQQTIQQNIQQNIQQTTQQTTQQNTQQNTNTSNETRTYPSFISIAGVGKQIDLDEWLKKDLTEADFEKYSTKEQYVNESGYTRYLKDIGYDKNGCPIREQNNCNPCCDPCDNTSSSSSSSQKPNKKKFRELADKHSRITKDIWEKKVSSTEKWEKYAVVKKYMEEEQYNLFLADKKKEQEAKPTEKPKDTEPPVIEPPIKDDKNTQPTVTEPSEKDIKNTTSKESSESIVTNVDSVEWKLNAKIAYTYKKRNLRETKKRTYIFNRQTAINQIIHPCGMITVDGTDFDLERQVMVGRLGVGFFRKHTIKLYSSLDFDTYHLKQISIDLKHPESTGHVVSLTKEKPEAEIEFYSEEFSTAIPTDSELKRQFTDEEITNETLSPKLLYYKVTLVFDSQKCVGFDPDQSFLFQTLWKTTTNKVIAIGPDDIAGIYALNITAGNLTLNQGLNTALLSLLPVHDSTLGPSIYDLGITSDTNDTILLNPNNHYKAQINYTLNEPYNNIPISQRALTVTTASLERKELIIQNPTSGMILFTTAQGEDTYQNIISIDILLQQGNREHSFTLTKRKPEYYFVTNYNAEDPEKITVKSVILNRNDGTSTNFTPNQTEFYTDRTEYVLSI